LTTAIHILLWALACLVAAPLCVLSTQCLLGLLPARRHAGSTQNTTSPTVAVLVPAHNEEGVIATTLESLKRALPESGRIVVVADNCTDNTASVARDHGATVIERHDTANRGKGFALAAGLASLESDPPVTPAVVIIVDADCTITPTTLTDLAHTAQASNRPVQGIYLLTPPDKRDPKAVVSAFAFLIKNQARPRGMDLLGLPIPLTGSGMAFPYALLKDANLATGNIVEDLALGLELAEQGHGPVLCDAARITGALPGGDGAAVTQRTRWEHGYLSTLLTRSPGLFLKGLFAFRPTLIAAAVDLAVPPLSLLVMGSAAALGPIVVIGWWVGSLGPACLLAASLAIAALSLVLAWARFGRLIIPISAALAIPGYILWKLPIYAKFLAGREKTWVRTERDQAPASNPGSPGPTGTPGNGTSNG
jgi:cellulose synthase/poly-beta-1,6-N-acetylglucosamine synthase-like glycosyltransferase